MIDTIDRTDPIAEARADLAAAQQRQADLGRRKRAAERARDAAQDEREALLGRIAKGEDVPTSAVEEAAVAVGAAAADVAVLEEALPKAEAAIQMAEQRLGPRQASGSACWSWSGSVAWRSA